MAWKLLPTDYTDAVWSGLKRYTQIDNSDGTVSFNDVTAYTNKEKSFFGAKDANRMNEALNHIMSIFDTGGSGIIATVNTYTNFLGGITSDGFLTVTKKLGVCYISGSITVSKSITDWTTILTSSQVPAPQHGKLIPFNVPAWGSSYTAALRGRISADGGLQIRLGAAREYVFSLSYPIE